MAQDAPFVEALGVMDQLLASFEDHSDADAVLDVQRMVEEAATTAHEREAAVAQSIRGALSTELFRRKRQAPSLATPPPTPPSTRANTQPAPTQPTTPPKTNTALCQRTAELEREADYEQRRAAHSEAVAAMRQRSDAEKQQGGALAARLEELERALAGVDDRAGALQAARRELRRRETEEAPRKVHQISLYAHITRLAFSSGSKGEAGAGAGAASSAAPPVHRGTVTDARTGEVRSVEVDLRAPNEGGRETAFERANRVWAQL
jgi:hypothetical protein